MAVCAGHGGYKSLNPKLYATAGKRTPDGEPEWTFNDKLVRAFMEEMNKYNNVEVRRFDDPTGKTDVSLNIRTNLANALGADIYISFHHNANTAKWGNWTGVETFVYTTPDSKSLELAECVHPELVKAYGLRDRGIKRANLHIVRETKMPSILIEGGFMDSVIDIKKLRDDNVLKNAGIGVACGVVKYANLSKKSNSSNNITSPILPQPETLMWGKTIFKKGQIGKITITKPINLWSDKNGQLKMERILLPAEEFRVYGYREKHGGQYDVGGGMWITKMPEHIKYETPSKVLLAKAKELYG
ncbi:N-acetylmuramoyl-L-alanine amidase [Bacillus sp. Bva_UNVM-123]